MPPIQTQVKLPKLHLEPRSPEEAQLTDNSSTTTSPRHTKAALLQHTTLGSIELIFSVVS